MTAIASNGIAELSRATARLSGTLSGPMESPWDVIRIALRSSRNLTRTLQETAQQLEAAHRQSPAVEIDPDDCLEQQLITGQARIRELWLEVVPVRSALSIWRHPMAKMGAMVLAAQIREQFRLMEHMRTLVKEHDADASPRSAAFSDHESLMRHLRGN